MDGQALKRLISQLTFGVDTIVGLGTYVLFSLIFHEPVNIWVLAFAGFCAYLPDLDFIYFMMQSKETRKWGHWRLGFHHPLVLLPVVGVSIWYLSGRWFPEMQLYLTCIAVTSITGHFLHDSTSEMGLHWFSPLNFNGGVSLNPLRWAHYRLSENGFTRVPHVELEQVYRELACASESCSTGDEIAMRIEEVTTTQYAWFGLCVIGFAALLLSNGYRLPF